MEVQTARVVKILPTKIWIESDFCGSRHVMRQHEGHKPAQLATVYYCYGHTDNSSTRSMAEMIAKALGAIDPIEHRAREFNPKADT
ncbi:hypothetical protein [Comamonas sp. 4034]|uniref:hypothetical protein n=1 Tax=Comamonas sp. 4034 TaxID=3156455 RepID=UPI003D254CCF